MSYNGEHKGIVEKVKDALGMGNGDRDVTDEPGGDDAHMADERMEAGVGATTGYTQDSSYGTQGIGEPEETTTPAEDLP